MQYHWQVDKSGGVQYALDKDTHSKNCMFGIVRNKDVASNPFEKMVKGQAPLVRHLIEEAVELPPGYIIFNKYCPFEGNETDH